MLLTRTLLFSLTLTLFSCHAMQTPGLKETPNTRQQNESTQTNNKQEKSAIKKEKKNIPSYTSYPNVSMAAIILIMAIFGLLQQ